MKSLIALSLLNLCLGFGAAQAAMVTKDISYDVGGKSMKSVLVYDDTAKTARPGLVMTPDWMGMNDNQIALAKQIAGKDYVILVADVYGSSVRPKNADLYYGVRKREDENRTEIPRYHEVIELTEAAVHELAAVPSKKFSDFPRPWLPPLPPIKGSDDGRNTGIIKPPAAAQAEFKVAADYTVNLFASEVEFRQRMQSDPGPLSLTIERSGQPLEVSVELYEPKPLLP